MVLAFFLALRIGAPALAHPGHAHPPKDFYKNFVPMSKPMPAGASARLSQVLKHIQTADVAGLMADYHPTNPHEKLDQTRQIFSHPLTRAMFQSMRYTPLAWEPGQNKVRVRLKVTHPHWPFLQKLFRAFSKMEHKNSLEALDKKALVTALQKGDYPKASSETLLTLVKVGDKWFTITLPLPDMEKNPGHTSGGAPEKMKSPRTKGSPSSKQSLPSPPNTPSKSP